MEPILMAEEVSKVYSRNASSHLSYGLRDLLDEIFGRSKNETLRKDEFLAVNSVSLALNRGDTLALVGRNGSGKTTLLKILNGLVKPDRGRVVVRGRVQAMINLGAGFAPSLSGRDNIYNSASLMGLNRHETTAILDEIIDFSELEEFIDSPVNTYSSGMKARLGFAVAVHLRPEILLIDEILAVGDFAFQNKCFTKMQQLKKNGMTIVLVSHSHTRVIQLCETALWLHKGKTVQVGPSQDTVQSYLAFLEEQEKQKLEKVINGPPPARAAPTVQTAKAPAASTTAQSTKTPPAAARPAPAKAAGDLYGPAYAAPEWLQGFWVELLVDGREAVAVPLHSPVCIRYGFTLAQPVKDLNVTIAFYRNDGLLMSSISTLNGNLLKSVHEGRVQCEVRIPDFDLAPGSYVLVMPIHEGHSYLYRQVVKEFMVVSGGLMTWGIKEFRYEYRIESPPHAAGES